MNTPEHSKPDPLDSTGSAEFAALWADLDARSERLDADTLDRLRGARRVALARVGAKPAHAIRSWIAAAAFAGLAAIMLWPQAVTTAVPPAPVSMEAFGMLASPDEVEVLESLDFYLWVESQAALSDEHG